MTPQVYVAGEALASAAKVADLVIAHEWSTAGIGGPVAAQFTALMQPNRRPSWLTRGARAEVSLSALNILAGQITETDWDTGEITIQGAAREGATTACLSALGVTTSTPDTAVTAAITRGALTWNLPASVSTAPLSTTDQTANLNYVADLLAGYVQEHDVRLYVDPQRSLRQGADPTMPTVFVEPGVGELAWATENQATTIIGRWADSAGKLTTTVVGSGPLEQLVDLTPKGPLTLVRATNLLNSILARCTAGGWTGGLTVSAEGFVGRPHLASVAERVGTGLMVRNLGQKDPRPGMVPTPYVDFIVERSEWPVADSQIILTPRGMVSRDFAAILADFGLGGAA